MKKILKFEKGYTLVEILVVIMLLVTVGGIIVAILSSSLRGSSKSSSLNVIRQSGNVALFQMAKTIEYAKVFNGVSRGTFDPYTGEQIYTTDCTVTNPPPPSPTVAPIQYSSIKITSFDGGTTVYTCGPSDLNNPDSPTTISSTSAAFGSSTPTQTNLIDTSTLLDNTKINVVSCYFLCTQTDSLNPPTIDINFSLNKQAAGGFFESDASIPFRTTVLIRNFNN